MITTYGNESYKSVKLWEPIITDFILNFYHDPHVDQHSFWNMISADVISSQGEENEQWMTDHLALLNELLTPYAHENSDILSQLFGLYRIWGHPTVDGLQGIRKLKELVRHQHCSDQNSIQIVLRKWREYFSTSYYKQEGRWPQFDPQTFEQESFLTRSLQEGYPLDQLHPDSDWDYVVFGQNLSVPEIF